MHCPHCDRPCTVVPLAQVTAKNIVNARVTYRLIVTCNNGAPAHNAVYIETSKQRNTLAQDPHKDFLDYYPSGPLPTAHGSIPKHIGNDWVEAQKAINVGALTAAAVMCRRVLYGVILDKECKEHPLHEGIEQLVALIRPPVIVEEWLKEIKEDGHDAAHHSRL